MMGWNQQANIIDQKLLMGYEDDENEALAERWDKTMDRWRKRVWWRRHNHPGLSPMLESPE